MVVVIGSNYQFTNYQLPITNLPITDYQFFAIDARAVIHQRSTK
ncbi:hypothetical protein [Lyngbya sp. CCAP 1446/10]|nr:hypothetical protein [Lyngbya sp. CCAP 1446/10]